MFQKHTYLYQVYFIIQLRIQLILFIIEMLIVISTFVISTFVNLFIYKKVGDGAEAEGNEEEVGGGEVKEELPIKAGPGE